MIRKETGKIRLYPRDAAGNPDSTVCWFGDEIGHRTAYNNPMDVDFDQPVFIYIDSTQIVIQNNRNEKKYNCNGLQLKVTNTLTNAGMWELHVTEGATIADVENCLNPPTDVDCVESFAPCNSMCKQIATVTTQPEEWSRVRRETKTAPEDSAQGSTPMMPPSEARPGMSSSVCSTARPRTTP